MPNESKYQITYTLTAWDYAAMARALTRRPWHRSIITLVLWLISVWCLLVLFTDLYNPVTMINAIAENGSWLWLPACLLVVAFFSLGTHWLAWGASFLYYRQIASADATISISLSDDAIRVKSNVADSTVPWATVKRVIREENYLLLPISKREAFILPRRGFETQDSFEDAFRYVTEKILAGTVGAG
ncbi:YcxB family protein [Pararhizobium qamdonense]|uniref:YcxB family protein n=1 Tax=Pararhizobium qamdonense TaxID=3031126 RepID=UPI0023E29A49|nr:YcxB family protein [Pararhizobium qamdonense]